MTRSSLTWLLLCRWGVLLCAETVSFQGAAVGFQQRSTGRSSQVGASGNRREGGREEGRRAITKGPVAVRGLSGLHEEGGTAAWVGMTDAKRRTTSDCGTKHRAARGQRARGIGGDRRQAGDERHTGQLPGL